MAKSVKKAKKVKKAPKKAKKTVKTKKVAKAKKVVKKKAVKAKKVTKAKKVAKPKKSAKKAVAKKTATKKVKAVKKAAAPKKAAPKKAAKKVTPKEEVAPSKPMRRAATPTVPMVGKKKDNPISPLPKTPPQLNIFPALTQRPIAHKPAKAAAPSDKSRYNDDELKEFETLINGKLEKARSEFKILKETLNRNNDEGTDSTSGGNTKVLEDGAETAEKENLSQLAARQLKYISNLENALIRIKNGTYGICSVTGKLIPKERLIAVPHTTQSIEAKMMQTD
jgi:RNA polymerase-binding transcription factor DksA